MLGLYMSRLLGKVFLTHARPYGSVKHEVQRIRSCAPNTLHTRFPPFPFIPVHSSPMIKSSLVPEAALQGQE
jgi:hypothetical protein